MWSLLDRVRNLGAPEDPERDNRSNLRTPEGFPQNSGMLDADHCLCFGANLDEEGICLDYRGASESPAVVIGVWRGQPNENAVWIPLASSFSEFLEKYRSGAQASKTEGDNPPI